MPYDCMKNDSYLEGTVCIQNKQLSVSVHVESGAKLISLRSMSTGKEWLVRGDRSNSSGNSIGDVFSTSSVSGADECIPNIAPGAWQGADLVDHGEAWSVPWKLAEGALNLQRIVTEVELPITSWRLKRVVLFEGECAVLSYTLTNLKEEMSAFLWAWHPLFQIHPGDWIQLPEEVESLSVEVARNPDGGEGDFWSWPGPFSGIRLDQLRLGTKDDSYLKAFVGPVKEGKVTLHSPARSESLEISWNPTELPYLGLWICRGGWNGHQHLALEPTTAPADVLDEASGTWVEANGVCNWSFRLSFRALVT